MVTINSALEDIMRLDHASREMLLEILQKRQIESRREEIAKAAKQTLKEYHSSKTTALTVERVFEKLNKL